MRAQRVAQKTHVDIPPLFPHPKKVDSFAHRHFRRLCHAAHAQKLRTAFLRFMEADLSLRAPVGAVVAAVEEIVYEPHLQLLLLAQASQTIIHHPRVGLVSPPAFHLHHVSKTPLGRTSALLDPLVPSDARELVGTPTLVPPANHTHP